MPKPAEYLSLMVETGWSMPTLSMTEAALSASLCGVVATDEDKTVVGMARAIGDGVMKVYIQDVVVSKTHRGQGIGRKLMKSILAELKATCPSDCMIGLFAAEGRSDFYTKLGFISRPDIGFGPGMHGTLSELAKASGAA